VPAGCCKIEELADELWGQVDFPFEYDHRFGRTLVPGIIA